VQSSERLILHEFEDLENFDDYLKWLNDETVFRFLESKHRVSSEKEIWDYINETRKSGSIFKAVVLKPQGIHIGNLKIYNFRNENGSKSAEYSRFIGDKNYWGIGLGYELGLLALEYCFNSLDLDNVFAGCFESNIAAIKGNLKLGFKETKKSTKYIKEKDRFEKVLHFSINKSEFFDL